VSQSSAQPNNETQNPLQTVLNNEVYGESTNPQVYIVNLDGKVLLASQNTLVSVVNLEQISSTATNTTLSANSASPIVLMYPIQYHHESAYLIVQGTPIANFDYVYHSNPLANAIGLLCFIATFYLLTKRRLSYLKAMTDGLQVIAGGNLDFRIPENGIDELSQLAANMNRMTTSLQNQMIAERRAEQTKAELLTNVSHDLRTPLTLIMGYLRLLKDRKFDSEEQLLEYTTIAYEKSEKLGTLIEDLFTYTKVANQGVVLVRSDVSLNALLSQLMDEFLSLDETEEVLFTSELPKEPVMVHVDANQLTRVFENLLHNSIQHRKKPSSIHVGVEVNGKLAEVTVQNQTEDMSPAEITQLFDRFYRREASRTSTKGGSGLGLAIAQNIVHMLGGSIRCEAKDATICFIVSLPIVTPSVFIPVSSAAVEPIVGPPML
jgi:signal transduction histidine kinase